MVCHQVSVGSLPQRGFDFPHQAGCHIGDAVDRVLVEGVIFGVFDVQQDVVMLGRPAVFGPSAVIVCPDDLVQEALPPEDGIQQDFAVMHFAVVDMEIQAAGGFEQAVSLSEARFEEGQVIVIDIGVAFGTDLDGFIAPPAEAGTVTVGVAFGADLGARLGFAGVEGRIDVDQVNGFGGQGLQDGEVVTKVDCVGHGMILTGIIDLQLGLIGNFGFCEYQNRSLTFMFQFSFNGISNLQIISLAPAIIQKTEGEQYQNNRSALR